MMEKSQSNKAISKTTVSVSSESASVTFNPKTRNFSAVISTNNIIVCVVTIGILLLIYFVIKNILSLGFGGYFIFIILLGFLGYIVYLLIPLKGNKAGKTTQVLEITSDSFTPEMLNNFIKFITKRPLKELLRLPEPDAKYDAKKDKKIPFTNNKEKEDILKEQEEIIEKVTKELEVVANAPIEDSQKQIPNSNK